MISSPLSRARNERSSTHIVPLGNPCVTMTWSDFAAGGILTRTRAGVHHGWSAGARKWVPPIGGVLERALVGADLEEQVPHFVAPFADEGRPRRLVEIQGVLAKRFGLARDRRRDPCVRRLRHARDIRPGGPLAGGRLAERLVRS